MTYVRLSVWPKLVAYSSTYVLLSLPTPTCDSTCVCMQVVRIQLTDPSNGANIGVSSVAEISIPANDDPYGVVEFSADRITIGEIDTNVSVFRR